MLTSARVKDQEKKRQRRERRGVESPEEEEDREMQFNRLQNTKWPVVLVESVELTAASTISTYINFHFDEPLYNNDYSICAIESIAMRSPL